MNPRDYKYYKKGKEESTERILRIIDAIANDPISKKFLISSLKIIIEEQKDRVGGETYMDGNKENNNIKEENK
jgi:hypothetical protein